MSGHPFSPQAAMIVAAIERELEPAYAAGTADFLTSSVFALATGKVLVGQVWAPALPSHRRPIAAAYPEGRLTIDGVDVVLSLDQTIELGQSLRTDRLKSWTMNLEIPGTAYDIALAWYVLIGWQNADRIASRGVGCPTCRGTGLLTAETFGPGRCFPACDCLDVDWPDDWLDPARPDEELAREESGAWLGAGRWAA